MIQHKHEAKLTPNAYLCSLLLILYVCGCVQGARRLPKAGYRKHIEDISKRSKRIEYRYKFFVREKEKTKEEQQKMIDQLDEEHMAAERRRIEEQNRITESVYAKTALGGKGEAGGGGGDDDGGGGGSMFSQDLDSFLAAAEETEKKKKPAEDMLDELDSLIGDDPDDAASSSGGGADSIRRTADDDFAMKARARKQNRLTLMLRDYDDGGDAGGELSFDVSALTMGGGGGDEPRSGGKPRDINAEREQLRLETERLRAELDQARSRSGRGGY